ncbi:MAG: hypothetical protein U5K37_06185 [Natrialbaceae archaeon]|nr:hypothetical protein [Natrialbaceae archaeon]
MGLYDTVELAAALTLPEYPDDVGPPHEQRWQTKDIDRPFMATFRITADGCLQKEECHYESVPPAERPYAHRDDVDEGDLRYIAGSRRKVHDGWIDRSDYHGRFVITTSFDSVEEPVRYRITFTHGRLEEIERWR